MNPKVQTKKRKQFSKNRSCVSQDLFFVFSGNDSPFRKIYGQSRDTAVDSGILASRPFILGEILEFHSAVL